jgi:tRNA(adenine34) deaminase
MCAGAVINARIGRLFFGCYDPKAGCAGTLYNLPVDKRFNHRAEVVGGILENECITLIQDFFKNKRN